TTVGSNVLVPEGACAKSPGDHHAITMTSVTVTNTTEIRVRIDIPPLWRATEPAARSYSPAERGQMVAFPCKTERLRVRRATCDVLFIFCEHAALPRIYHRLPAATADTLADTALRSVGRLDVLSSTPAAASVARLVSAASPPFRSATGEKCG